MTALTVQDIVKAKKLLDAQALPAEYVVRGPLVEKMVNYLTRKRKREAAR